MREPSYIKLYREGELDRRLEKALAMLEDCTICPRECHVNRVKEERGFCGTGRKLKVAAYNPHFGEESPLVGRHGSGTIFLSSCNLLCNFCQNYDISHLNEGMEAAPRQMASMMIHLAERGCHNINFVTPTHMVPQILEALVLATHEGLKIPLVYNSSGYDKKETLELLEGVFDIYMPDFKFWDGKWAERYCRAPDYREVATEAVKEMHRQVGDLVVDKDGIAVRGLLIRHLVMPRNIAGSDRVARFIAEEVSPNTYVNIMDQYRPCGDALRDEFINRRIEAQEFQEALKTAGSAGLKRLDSRDRVRFVLPF